MCKTQDRESGHYDARLVRALRAEGWVRRLRSEGSSEGIRRIRRGFPEEKPSAAAAERRKLCFRRTCRVFRIDGERGFMVLYACSPELNSVATEVRTGVLKVVGLKLIESC